MSRLEELITEFCPDGVEYVGIGNAVNYEQPSKYIVESTDYKDDFFTPVLTAGLTFILGYTDEKDNIYNASKKNPVIIFDDFTGAFKWVDFPFKVKSSAMKILTANADKATLRFIYHIMGNIGYSSDEHKRLWISIYSKILIPLPPPPVQSEIVRILDCFTELTEELTEELTAELTARKKQYVYYKDELLIFGDDVPRLPLGKCLEKTNNFKWKQFDGTLQYIDLSSVDRDLHIITQTTTVSQENAPSRAQQIVQKNDVLFGSTRPMLKRSCFVTNEHDAQVCSTGFCVLRANTDKVLPTWIYYMISTADFYTHVELFQKGASYPAISDADIKRYEIPLPSLAEQEKVVNILSKFEILCNDITAGLSAEIEARRKQYEYYRGKLLTFEEASA